MGGYDYTIRSAQRVYSRLSSARSVQCTTLWTLLRPVQVSVLRAQKGRNWLWDESQLLHWLTMTGPDGVGAQVPERMTARQHAAEYQVHSPVRS